MIFAVVGVLAIYPMGLLLSLITGSGSLLPMLAGGLVASSVATLAAGMTTKPVLDFIARRQVRALFRIYPGFCWAVDSVALRCRQRMKNAASRCRRQIAVLKKRHRRAENTPGRRAAGMDGGQEAARRNRAGGAGGLTSTANRPRSGGWRPTSARWTANTIGG